LTDAENYTVSDELMYITPPFFYLSSNSIFKLFHSPDGIQLACIPFQQSLSIVFPQADIKKMEAVS
jgi:hypothetical protein